MSECPICGEDRCACRITEGDFESLWAEYIKMEPYLEDL